MKMADIDINLFGEHDRIDEHSDEGETFLFTPGRGEGGRLEDLLGNQNSNMKHRSEEE